MNTAICVATMDLERIWEFYRNIPSVFFENVLNKIIIVITGNYNDSWYPFMEEIQKFNEDLRGSHFSGSDQILSVIYPSKRRWYSSVMKLKVDSCKEILGDDTCLFMADDDYFYNPYAFDFATKIMEQYQQVDYLCFHRGPGIIRDEQRIEKFLGLEFQRLTSALGGAVIVRWNIYKQHMEEYFQKYKVTDDDPGGAGMYDWHYFDTYLNTKYEGRKDNIYTLLKPSLVQHCNLVSHYVDDRRGPLDHMYSENFDPVGNPFKMGELEIQYHET